jgi:hypothetical protein
MNNWMNARKNITGKNWTAAYLDALDSKMGKQK